MYSLSFNRIYKYGLLVKESKILTFTFVFFYGQKKKKIGGLKCSSGHNEKIRHEWGVPIGQQTANQKLGHCRKNNGRSYWTYPKRARNSSHRQTLAIAILILSYLKNIENNRIRIVFWGLLKRYFHLEKNKAAC